jgi:hypothetical protein
MKTKEYSNKELNDLEKISDDLIIELFDTRDKRYAIRKALKKAFELGENRKNEN